MSIQKIQPRQSFQGKQKFVSRKMHENLKSLITNMNSETVYKERSGWYSSNVLRGLKINNEALLIDNRSLISPAKGEQFYGNSSLRFNRVNLSIDNASGEITGIKKPWYKSLDKVLNKAEQHVQTAFDNYNNNNVVKKQFSAKEGLTPDGILNLMKQVKTYFKNSFC